MTKIEDKRDRIEEINKILDSLHIPRLTATLEDRRKARDKAHKTRREHIRDRDRKRDERNERSKKLEELIEKGEEEGDEALKLEEALDRLDHDIDFHSQRIEALHKFLEDINERIDDLVKEKEDDLERQKRLRKAREELRKRIKEIKQNQEDKPPATGTGPWAGTQSIVEQEIVPIMQQYGAITSRKRWETFGNPGSDHYMGVTNAYAADCGIANRFDVAQKIRAALGVSGPHVDYQDFYITRAGRRFRVELIAGTHGTGPHLHAGVRAA